MKAYYKNATRYRVVVPGHGTLRPADVIAVTEREPAVESLFNAGILVQFDPSAPVVPPAPPPMPAVVAVEEPAEVNDAAELVDPSNPEDLKKGKRQKKTKRDNE